MNAYQLKIKLDESDPAIWRRLIVPQGYSFSQLAVILNTVMGWDHEHLFAFEFGTKKADRISIEEPEEDFGFTVPNAENAAGTITDDYFGRYKEFKYIYDFGDDWQHTVEIENIIADYPDRFPKLLEAEGACPWENCGGIYDYYEKLEILSDPASEEYKEIFEWTFGETEPPELDMHEVNRDLKQMKLSTRKKPPMYFEEILDLLYDGRVAFYTITDSPTDKKKEPEDD